MCKHGATALELVVVLGIVIIMVCCGVQLFSGLHRIVTRLELALLAVVIRSTQQYALITGTDQKILLHKDGSGYMDAHHTTHLFVPGTTLAAPPGALGPPAFPRTAITAPVTFPNYTVTCYKNGIVQSGTIYLGNRTHHSFYALTSGIALISLLRLYQYRLNWISL